jgi:site-specific recombinase
MSLKFTTLEYAHFERGADWYWILGIVTVAVLVAAIILGNTLFGLVIIVGAFGLSLYTARRPKEMTIEIDNKGIRIEKMLFPYTSLHSFCVSRDTHNEHLRLRSKKKFMPLISVILSGVSAEMVEEELTKYIPEEHFEISTLEKIMETLGL